MKGENNMSPNPNPLFHFEDAERIQCKASIMIEGLSGKGKSGLALIIGYFLAGQDWTKVYHIDTENRSAVLFSDIGASIGGTFSKFKIGNFTPDLGYKPSNYLAFREAAITSGAKSVISDSISHAWMYKGGVLDLLNDAKKSNKRYEKDSYAAWSDEIVAKEKLAIFDLIRDPRAHIITTVRVKEKLEYGTDDNGKSKMISLGDQQIMQGDIKYEPDLVLRMVRPGKSRNGVLTHPSAEVIKSRYAIFTEGEVYEFTPTLLEQLREYLEDGISPDELLERQRLDYVNGIKTYLDTNPNAVPIWNVLKKDAGYEKTKLDELPLDAIKALFIKLTID